MQWGTAQELKSLAAAFAKTMRCNCDLDNWEPEEPTGHSFVCRIRNAAESWRPGYPDPRSPPAHGDKQP